MVDTVVQAKAYWKGKDNFLLIPNREFGHRKLIHVGMNRQLNLGKKGNKQWIHPPDTLLRGHMVYNVKFLGHVEVDEPKGTEIVREAIRKMKFNKQLKKAEGQKPPKVELTISVDGVTVQDPKLRVVQHQYPLHRISYCADDKADKRMFTFIAKQGEANQHECFVFDSEKCAEEITLTIGQAFDLAYKKFMESSSKDIDMKKQLLLLQKKIQTLTHENVSLKERVADLERIVDPKTLEEYETSKNNPNATYASVSPIATRPKQTSCHSLSQPGGPTKSTQSPAIMSPKNNKLASLATPPRLSPPTSSSRRSSGTRGQVTNGRQPVVGRKLENLILEDESTAHSNQANGTPSLISAPPGGDAMPVLAPPPPVPSRSHQTPHAPDAGHPVAEVDLFGLTPFSPNVTSVPASNPAIPPPSTQAPILTSPANPFAASPIASSAPSAATDPFGMEAFSPTQQPQNIDQELLRVDRELMDLQSGFSQGLSLGTEDFNLADLDPLNKK